MIKQKECAKIKRTERLIKLADTIHDKGYKKIFSKKKNFIDFLKKYINESWVNTINEDDLTLIDKEFISEDYLEKESDIIYKASLNNGEGSVYFYCLLEMQSSVDFSMPFRLLCYMTELLKKEFSNVPREKRKRKEFKLPAVVPIVLYNGKTSWTAELSFKNYFVCGEKFGNAVIDFTYLLLDLTKESEEFIVSTNNLIDNIFVIDKNKSKDEVIEVLRKTIVRFSKLNTEERNELIIWLRGTLKAYVNNEKEVEEIIEQVEKGKVGNMKSGIAMAFEDYAEEKVKEATEKVAKEVAEKVTKEVAEKVATNTAIKLLKKGMDIGAISEITELSIEDIKQIQMNEKNK